MKQTNNMQIYDRENKYSLRSYIYALCHANHAALYISENLNHPFWVINSCYNYQSRIRFNDYSNQYRERLPGDIYLIPPNTRYGQQISPLDNTTEKETAFACVYGGEELGLTHFVDNAWGYAIFKDPRGQLGNLLRKTAQIAKGRNEKGFWLVQSQLFIIIDCLHESRHENDNVYILDTTERMSDKVRNYLNINYKRKITLREIAGHLNISESSLSHRFLEETGESPMTFLQKIRTNQAKIMLLYNARMKNIAEETGFYDEFHFSRTFKKVEGISPSDYKKRSQRPN